LSNITRKNSHQAAPAGLGALINVDQQHADLGRGGLIVEIRVGVDVSTWIGRGAYNQLAKELIVEHPIQEGAFQTKCSNGFCDLEGPSVGSRTSCMSLSVAVFSDSAIMSWSASAISGSSVLRCVVYGNHDWYLDRTYSSECNPGSSASPTR
jgi:hypothetical protein